MSDTDSQVPLPDLNNAAEVPAAADIGYNEDDQSARIAADLEAVFDVPYRSRPCSAAPRWTSASY